MVGQLHSRWLFTKSDSSKNLQIENQSLSCQVSTLVTTWPSFRLLPIWLQTTLVAINSESCQTLFQSFCLPPSEVAVLFYSNLRLSRLPVLRQVACHLRQIWRQTLVVIDSESCQTLFPSFCATPSEVAVLFNSNLNRLLVRPVRTGRQLRSAALHRIWLGICCFCSYIIFYSETNEWLQDWAKQWAQLWLATTFGQFHEKLHMKKKTVFTARYLQSIKTFLTLELTS